MFEPEWDAGLDDAQLAAAAHAGGPLVIVAGAGTGKTRTLTARVARLLARGADPSPGAAADLHPPRRRRHAGPGRRSCAATAARPDGCGAAPSTRWRTG